MRLAFSIVTPGEWQLCLTVICERNDVDRIGRRITPVYEKLFQLPAELLRVEREELRMVLPLVLHEDRIGEYLSHVRDVPLAGGTFRLAVPVLNRAAQMRKATENQ